MIKYRVLRRNLHVQLPFEIFLFRFGEAATSFFECIQTHLGARFGVVAKELSLVHSQIFGEVQAKYSIFGGVTSVTLRPDALAFDFPGIEPKDDLTVAEVMQLVHDNLPEVLPSVRSSRIEIQDYAHLEIGRENVDTYLRRFSVPFVELQSLGKVTDPIEYIPGGKVQFSSALDKWFCSMLIERSAISQSAVFIAFTLNMRDVTSTLSYQQKRALVEDASRACFNLLGLEYDNAGQQ